MTYLIDGLQYARYSEKIFRQIREVGLDAIHVTISYHENFRETVANIEQWNLFFEQFPDLIFQGFTFEDVMVARQTKRTAVFFGLQNPAPIEDDIGLIEILHQLGVRFMQLTYNNQSLLATGCYEKNDAGITRMGKQVIQEMNRVGMVIDMSHSSERSTLESIELSTRPIVISHANPSFWKPALRNKSNELLRSLADSGSMLGFSLYPHHLKDGSDCTQENFVSMIAQTVQIMGTEQIGIGSDLCQDQPDDIVAWMRNGRWTKEIDFGEGSKDNQGFPPMPRWFEDSRGFANIADGLKTAGFREREIQNILGDNWFRFFRDNFSPIW